MFLGIIAVGTVAIAILQLGLMIAALTFAKRVNAAVERIENGTKPLLARGSFRQRIAQTYLLAPARQGHAPGRGACGHASIPPFAGSPLTLSYADRSASCATDERRQP
jgi:hypothetical protein